MAVDRFADKEGTVSSSTYVNFFSSNKANYVLVPLTIFLFIASEGIATALYRILADFNKVKKGTSSLFGDN